MPHIVRIRLVLLLALALPATILPTATGRAAVDMGRIEVIAYDGVSGRQIRDVCVTLTLPGDDVPVTPTEENYWEYYPVGTYDVLVEDCANDIYASQTFEKVDILPADATPVPEDQATKLEVFMELANRAAIAGRIVDSYSGYPLEGATVTLRTLDGTPFATTCTNEDGIYMTFAEPDIPVLVTFHRTGADCYGYGARYQRQWYPYATRIDDAVALTPTTGDYVIASGALDVAGGFVGRIVDPDDPASGVPSCLVRAWSGGSRFYTYTQNDGSFTAYRTGSSVTVELHCEGSEGGYLTEPGHPTRIEEWNVGAGDLIDLGLIGMERTPAISGRVVDQFGAPVQDAVVFFFAEGTPTIETQEGTVGYTDAQGYYVTNEPLVGRYTALVWIDGIFNRTRMDTVNGRWLGDTAVRGQATYLDFDGDNRGGVDIQVNRGEIASIYAGRFLGHGAQPLTTDREHDGATLLEPLEVAAQVETSTMVSLGSFYRAVPPFPGFDHTGEGATVIYSPPDGSPPLPVDFILDSHYLPDSYGDLQVVWNDRFLRSCTDVAAPCEAGRKVDARGDLVVSALLPSGGEASFVWGPSFLDTGLSIFNNDIEWLAGQGVTRGCTPPINDFFCPDDPVTRGQMAAFLVRFLGLTDRGTVDFTDDDGSVFEADIEKLAAAGITKGCNPPANDRFCPNDPVTREQMAAFLTRALGLPSGPSTDFTDDDGSIFEDAIERLAAAGITKGCNPPTNDRFCPKATVTREQMAAFLHRAGALRPSGAAAVAVSSTSEAPTSTAARLSPQYTLPEPARSAYPSD